jgi:hypothetical protein
MWAANVAIINNAQKPGFSLLAISLIHECVAVLAELTGISLTLILETRTHDLALSR